MAKINATPKLATAPKSAGKPPAPIANTMPIAPVAPTPAPAPVVAKPDKLASHLRYEAQVRKAYDRLAKISDKFDKWRAKPAGEVVAAHMTNARDCLKQCADALHVLPADWKAPRGSRGANAPKEALAAGTKVVLRPKALAKNEGLLDAADMPFTVINSNGKRVLCATAGGTKIFIPRGELALAEAVVKDDDDEDDEDADADGDDDEDADDSDD